MVVLLAEVAAQGADVVYPRGGSHRKPLSMRMMVLLLILASRAKSLLLLTTDFRNRRSVSLFSL